MITIGVGTTGVITNFGIMVGIGIQDGIHGTVQIQDTDGDGTIGMAQILVGDGVGIIGGDLITAIMVGVVTIIITLIIILTAMVFEEVVQAVEFQEDMILADLELRALETILQQEEEIILRMELELLIKVRQEVSTALGQTIQILDQ